MERVTIKPIHSAQEHEAALATIADIMAIETPDEADLAMLETLAVLVERYEEQAFPMEKPSALDAIRFRMDQMDLNQARLAALTGLPKSRISELLNGKRGLSLDMIRIFRDRLKIPADILINPSPASASS